MPIYEYTCHRCGHEFESIEKVGTEVVDCPNCLLGFGIQHMSTANFRVTGASYRNGYSSIPKREEVLDANGYAKKRWSR